MHFYTYHSDKFEPPTEEYARGRSYHFALNSSLELLIIAENEEEIKKFHKLGIYNAYDLLTFYEKPVDEENDYDHLIEKYYDYKKIFGEYELVEGREYVLTEAIFGHAIKRIIWEMPPIKDFLPDRIRFKFHFMTLADAIWTMHFKSGRTEWKAARRRLAFDELFLIQCGLRIAKSQSLKGKQAIIFKRNGKLFQEVYDSLPFQLTSEQSKVLKDIARDMESPTPMRRLIQGDVGSGKTVVAMLALVKAVENGYQGALMVPTEILAIQHYNNFVESLGRFGIRVSLLSAKVTRSKKAREEMCRKIANHEFDIVVGTHAMVQDGVEFARLGLAITDEQHRFGVSQRAKLSEKSNITPDILAMTATPIPRTMALTFYGDLDVSRIEQLPAGRKPVETTVMASRDRRSAYSLARREMKAGRQAYVVCPLRSGNSSDAYSAEEIYDMLTKGYFKNFSGALIHGKMKAAEKDDIMTRFKNGEIKYIVSTTVIEVGVNVPNATVIVIEDAERFGLAQLHQLRGRVGRGSLQSYCILLSSSREKVARERLGLMEKTTNGFELAEADLKMRGPGQFFGEKQFGMPDLKLANVFEDTQLFWDAYYAAEDFMKSDEFDKYIDDVKFHIRLAFKDKFEQINNV